MSHKRNTINSHILTFIGKVIFAIAIASFTALINATDTSPGGNNRVCWNKTYFGGPGEEIVKDTLFNDLMQKDESGTTIVPKCVTANNFLRKVIAYNKQAEKDKVNVKWAKAENSDRCKDAKAAEQGCAFVATFVPKEDDPADDESLISLNPEENKMTGLSQQQQSQCQTVSEKACAAKSVSEKEMTLESSCPMANRRINPLTVVRTSKFLINRSFKKTKNCADMPDNFAKCMRRIAGENYSGGSLVGDNEDYLWTCVVWNHFGDTGILPTKLILWPWSDKISVQALNP